MWIISVLTLLGGKEDEKHCGLKGWDNLFCHMSGKTVSGNNGSVAAKEFCCQWKMNTKININYFSLYSIQDGTNGILYPMRSNWSKHIWKHNTFHCRFLHCQFLHTTFHIVPFFFIIAFLISNTFFSFNCLFFFF